MNMRQLSRPFQWALSHSSLQPVASGIARFGLHCAGINLHHELQDSGELKFLQRVSRTIPGFVCFDIGANSEEYAQAALACGASSVVCFEPVPSTFAKLSRNLASKPVVLQNLAIGEQSGEITMFLPKTRDSTLASRDLAAADLTMDEAEEVTVKIATLDQVVTELGIYPDFLKIDVEGFELEVLQGARRLIASERRPKFIQFEFNSHHLIRRQPLAEFLQILEGYQLYRLTMSGVSPIGAYPALDKVYGYMNIVASVTKLMRTQRTI